MNRAAATLLGLACALPCFAADPQPASTRPMQGPWVPPEVAQRAIPAPQTRGEALRAQVRAKLRERFDAADAARKGTLSHAEARAAGLGIVASNFDRIDTARAGRVSFDDLLRYLRARGADL